MKRVWESPSIETESVYVEPRGGLWFPSERHFSGVPNSVEHQRRVAVVDGPGAGERGRSSPGPLSRRVVRVRGSW